MLAGECSASPRKQLPQGPSPRWNANAPVNIPVILSEAKDLQAQELQIPQCVRNDGVPQGNVRISVFSLFLPRTPSYAVGVCLTKERHADRSGHLRPAQLRAR